MEPNVGQSKARLATSLRGGCTASAPASSKAGILVTVVAAKGSGAREAGRGGQGGMLMAP